MRSPWKTHWALALVKGSREPPYLGRFSTVAQSKIRRLVNRYCNDLDIKLLFITFKLRNLFSVKESVPRELLSRVIYKFTCACCNACYIGETGRHFSTRVREHEVASLLCTSQVYFLSSRIVQFLSFETGKSDVCGCGLCMCVNSCFLGWPTFHKGLKNW